MKHLTWDYFRRRIDLNDSKMPAFLAKNGVTSYGEFVSLLNRRGVEAPSESEVEHLFNVAPPKKEKPKPKTPAPRPKTRRPRKTSAKLGEKARKEVTDSKSATKSDG